MATYYFFFVAVLFFIRLRQHYIQIYAMVQAECGETGKTVSIAFDVFYGMSMEFDDSDVGIDVKKQIGVEVPNARQYVCLCRIKIQVMAGNRVNRYANGSTVRSCHCM